MDSIIDDNCDVEIWERPGISILEVTIDGGEFFVCFYSFI